MRSVVHLLRINLDHSWVEDSEQLQEDDRAGQEESGAVLSPHGPA
jgi:hypothetical protein